MDQLVLTYTVPLTLGEDSTIRIAGSRVTLVECSEQQEWENLVIYLPL